VAACAFLHQSRPREISPPMAHLKDGRATDAEGLIFVFTE
jgi:hypothetical protein